MNALPIVHAHLQDFEHVSNKLGLHLAVYGRIVVERWQMIHLKEPRLQLVVKHYVETQELIAVLGLSRLAAPIVVLKLGLHSDHSLDDYLLNL